MMRWRTIVPSRHYKTVMSYTFTVILSVASMLLICGLAGAVGYGSDSGIDNITSLNCSIWSTLLSNNDSTVTCDIDVKSGALNLSNATIRMDGNSIWVRNGATMNVTDGSTITRHDSGYYNFNYESGSRGNLSDSAVEYSNELNIRTSNNITIDNCTIRNNQHHGIHLTSTSGYVNITDCDINNTVNQHGIFIESSQDNILRNNNLNNNSGNYSLYVTGNYDQDIDTTNKVNGGTVHYLYNESGTTTDTNIGHVTIVDCSDLWFTNCTIHNGDGVRIRGVSSNVSIVGGEIENNTMCGIKFELTSWNNITSVDIENNTGQGVYLVDSSNNTINESDILNNTDRGIDTLGSSSDNQIINNRIINNSIGIYLDGKGDNTLTDNNVSGNRDHGIQLGSESGNHLSTHNILHNNTVQSNDETGIVFNTNYNRLTKNNISDNGNFTFALCDEMGNYFYYNHIWRNNTANGEQINYYYDEHDTIIEQKYLSASNVSNVGKITLINCTNITIRDSELSNNSKSDSESGIESGIYGIFLWNSSNNNLTNITMWDNYHGIRLYGSSHNNITDLDIISPSDQYGAQFEESSNYNNITGSIIAGIASNGMSIFSSSHTNLTNTTISSVDQYGLSSTSGAHYTTLTNVTITSSSSDGVRISSSHHVTTRDDSSITASNTGVHCTNSNHTEIINTTIEAGTDGIYMSESHWGNLTNNIINATEKGIFLTESRDHNLTKNNITNYTIIGILLEEYSTNTTMIGNNLTRNGSEFDIRINDSNGAAIANNESTAANYTFYLTGNTSLCTLDIVFDKTKVGYEDLSNLTLMWRIDVLCWDNYHKETMWSNLTVRYSDFSDANGSLCWEGEISAGADDDPDVQGGRLSGNLFGYWGPPTSSDNWLPIIEYRQNVSGKTTYQPMNCTAINRWDVLQGIYDRTYRNVTTTITEPGVTILVDTGYTPNSKCYYCHVDKLTFANTKHWTKYEINVTNMTDSYTPGRCIDCHDENDSIGIPHGNVSGKDLLYYPSPQLCYTGRTGGLDCHSTSATPPLDQETEFNQTTHHPLGDGKLACKACHDNHGTDYPSDLLKKYETTTSGGYNSSNYALCLVCHLEEKLVAKMSGETGHLANYANQTNFRSEYWYYTGFSGVRLKNIHSPQGYRGDKHTRYNCYACHNPHGSDNPATTRYESKAGSFINYTYITNLTPPGVEYEDGDWLNQIVIDDPEDWNNSAMNQAGGLYMSAGVDGCGCHKGYDEYGNLRNYFAYREFIDYEPAGGAGCLECHDNNASAYNQSPIRPIVNLTAIKLAMHTNLSGAFRTGSILQGTTRTFTGWLEHREYTAEQIANITEDNAICWACHSTNGTPPSPGFHPDRALNPYKCPKCHGPYDGQPPHTQGLVAAIDNHGPTTKGASSILIQTDVGNGGSCGDCHAPSVLPERMINDPNTSDDDFEVWKYTDENKNVIKNFVAYEGTTTMGNVSHYGLNRSQGEDLEIDNPLCNTTDCLFCHCNWTNGQIWGNATNISGNMYGANTSNVSECYTYCHVRPDWVGSVNESTLAHFHNESIYAGGGPNCVVCHDVASKYGVQSRVNTTAIAGGIHGNILNNTLVHEGFGMDNRSKPCWGCHNSDGTIPEGMGDRNGITDIDGNGVITVDELPYTCEDCHARSETWNSATDHGETWQSASDPDLGLNRLPPEIIDHYPNSTLVKTNRHSSNGRCVDCHNNSIDQNNSDTAYKILGNTIFSNVSHYGTSEDLLTLTKTCRYCHNDTANATLWGNAIQNEHGNYTDEANTVDGCYSCHANNQTPASFHNMNTDSITGDPDCLRCHGSNGSAVRRRINETVYEGAIHARMNNATTGPNGINQSCWVCHFPDGLGMDEHNKRREPAYNCIDCHNKNSTPLFSNVSDAPNAYNHFKNGTSIQAYWTRPTDLDSCMGCHNQPEMNYSFSENDTYYTNFSKISHYGDNLTYLVNMNDSNDNNTEYCSYCHVNDTPFMEFENIIVNITHAGDSNCEDCHGTGRLHSNSVMRANTSGNCTDCHALYGANRTNYMGNGTIKYEINVTAMNLGVHANVNSNMTSVAAAPPVNDGNNSKCWGCHVPGGAYPVNGHEDTFNNDAYLCYDCHNGTAKAYDNMSCAPAVYNHFNNGVNISARTNALTISESCGDCHNLTTMKVADFDAGGNASYRVNLSQASHYTRNRTDIATDNLSDCTWCHRNSTNEFIDIFERNGAPNYTENIPHAENLNSCILEDCHRSGRIHDSNLTKPTWSWGAECKNCHFGLTDSIYYVNETMFDASVHGTVNCTDCHIDESSSHPIEEYYWKWCECCHSYQTDPINENDRHNVTTTPSTYSVGGTNVLDITDCTTCHNAATYNASVDYYNTYKCRYCHVYPDKGNRTSQEWY